MPVAQLITETRGYTVYQDLQGFFAIASDGTRTKHYRKFQILLDSIEKSSRILKIKSRYA